MADVEQGDANEVELLAPSTRDFQISKEELQELNEVRESLSNLRICRILANDHLLSMGPSIISLRPITCHPSS